MSNRRERVRKGEAAVMREVDLQSARARNLEEQRLALLRTITIIGSNWQNLWRTCTNRQCRRAQSCYAPENRCRMVPQSTQDPWADDGGKFVFEMRQALAERRAQIEAEKAAEAARESLAQIRLATKRDATKSRKQPKAISSPRRGSQCASRTP